MSSQSSEEIKPTEEEKVISPIVRTNPLLLSSQIYSSSTNLRTFFDMYNNLKGSNEKNLPPKDSIETIENELKTNNDDTEIVPRILVVSNRLPVTVSKKSDVDPYSFIMSSGGLVAGLEGVKKKLSFMWIGWPGTWIPPKHQDSFSKKLLSEHNCVPVFLEDKLADDHYNGFSNGVLWPLFHYLVGESNFDESLWKSYVEANKRFADVISQIWQPGDLVWIHDYHLLKLPEILRERIPEIKVGLFLHIPFPSSEIFQVLPVRKSIMHGLLSCDLVGFHTYDYARHFVSSCARILGLETTPAGVNYDGRFVPISVFPVGIDPDKFEEQLKVPTVQEKIEQYLKNFEGKKILLGIDRLDYIKGIPHKLKALEIFFQKYPEWRGKVVLIQIAVPSRTDVLEYQKLKNEVEALVGHINGTYGSLNFNPIHYLFKSVAFDELCALYRISDAVIITSIRDGMNLVSQEYIACQKSKHGVLILSEFAGSATALCGSVLVNPWNFEQIADSINEALTLSPREKEKKFKHLWEFISRHTASYWGESFIRELRKASKAAEDLRSTPRLTAQVILPEYLKSSKRIIILQTDGFLIPFAPAPFLARPSRKVISVLTQLTKDPKNIVYVISGRDRNTMSTWFGNIPVSLVAEHGFFSFSRHKKHPENTPQWKPLTKDPDVSWKQTIKPIFQYFTDRTPGSYFEEKEISLTWHYRATERKFGAFRAKELQSHLDKCTFPVNVINLNKTIEVRPYECNSTTVLKKIIHKIPDYNFLLYIGEPVNIDFSESEAAIFTCSVGQKTQKFFLQNPDEVIHIFERINSQ